MNPQEREAIALIALLAAFADGNKTDAERDEVRRVAEALDEEATTARQSGNATGEATGNATGAVPMARLYRDVLLGQADLDRAVAELRTPATRQLAYELAVGVVDADGQRNAAETAFLERLASRLQIDDATAKSTLADADALATAPVSTGLPTGLIGGAGAAGAAGVGAGSASAGSGADAGSAAGAGAGGGTGTGGVADGPVATTPGSGGQPGPADADLDKMILNASILNGALELLPQSLASMAIIPLQMKMVYGIGRQYGYTLDRAAIGELLATLGVGVTGQYLEDVGRKLLGGLLGKVGGKMLGGLGRTATGVAFSFATTWAIGQVARRYYAGGRTMSPEALRSAFGSLFEEAKGLQQRYLPQIEAESRRIDLPKLLQQVRGK